MKLFDATGEEAFELAADLIDPISEIAGDEEIVTCMTTNQKLKAIKFAMKKHPKTLVQIMAVCEGVPVEEYKDSLPVMMYKLLKVLNHPMVSELFSSQGQTEVTSSGSVTENTEAQEK